MASTKHTTIQCIGSFLPHVVAYPVFAPLLLYQIPPHILPHIAILLYPAFSRCILSLYPLQAYITSMHTETIIRGIKDKLPATNYKAPAVRKLIQTTFKKYDLTDRVIRRKAGQIIKAHFAVKYAHMIVHHYTKLTIAEICPVIGSAVPHTSPVKPRLFARRSSNPGLVQRSHHHRRRRLASVALTPSLLPVRASLP